jgi:hypothetical protein
MFLLDNSDVNPYVSLRFIRGLRDNPYIGTNPKAYPAIAVINAAIRLVIMAAAAVFLALGDIGEGIARSIKGVRPVDRTIGRSEIVLGLSSFLGATLFLAILVEVGVFTMRPKNFQSCMNLYSYQRNQRR